MKFVVKSIALAALVLMTSGQSYAGPLRSTSIPSSLAYDEKRLMPKVMSEFYGSFDREKACWISKHEDATYCMKPIRLDVRWSSGRKMLFVVAGGQTLDEEGRPLQDHAAHGVFGLIVLTPNGANLGVLATNGLYEEFANYGRYPQHDTVTVHKLGPNGKYGWVEAEYLWFSGHGGPEVRGASVYGMIGNSVKDLTTITSYYSDEGTGGCGPEVEVSCTTLSVKYTFDTHSSASSFYPLTLQVSGIQKGRPFRGNYRLVFDEKSLKYLRPENVPDEIMPQVEVRHDRSCDVAQDHPEKFNFNPEGGNAVMFGGCGKIEDILANSPSRTAWWGAVNCGYFAYRENKKRDASPYLNEDLKRGWAYGWDTAAKACKRGKLPVFGP